MLLKVQSSHQYIVSGISPLRRTLTKYILVPIRYGACLTLQTYSQQHTAAPILLRVDHLSG